MSRPPGSVSATDRAPSLVHELARACADRGGRAYLVGGCVRDALLGREVVDWDVEVHRIPEADLLPILASLGSVDAVGRAFAVFKVTRRGLTIDVSLPRRDSNAGPGHRGIAVHGDPFLGIREAARRRDLTINAILQDILTGAHEDPFGGIADLRARVLRAVDPRTFLEDPLRALRVCQFAARLDFTVAADLLALCREATVHELPAERVRDEWFKLLRAPKPSTGLDVAARADLVERLFPGAPTTTGPTMDAVVAHRDQTGPEGRQLALMLLAWLHPAPRSVVDGVLARLGLVRWRGYRLADAVLDAHDAADAPADTDADLRRLATRAEPFLVLAVRAARGDPNADAALRRARDLGLLHEPERPLLQGRDLLRLGLPHGPRVGRLLDTVYDAQLDGRVRDKDAALALARTLIHP